MIVQGQLQRLQHADLNKIAALFYFDFMFVNCDFFVNNGLRDGVLDNVLFIILLLARRFDLLKYWKKFLEFYKVCNW